MKSLGIAGIAGSLVLFVATSTVSKCDVLPTSLLREFQDFQDDSAFGVVARQGRREEIDARLEASLRGPAPGWGERRNVPALASFLLTGGDPAFARKAVALMPRDAADMSLVQNALVYADEESPQAARKLEAADLRAVSPEVAGALALVQAKLAMEHDRKVASEKLAAARILAPGGLIEEAALRQELFILDGETDFDTIRRIVGRYFSRFGRSAYVENFVQRLEVLSEQGWTSKSPESRTRAARTVEEAPIATRSRLALRMARVSLMRGHRAAARQALQIGCTDLPAGAGVEERCALYRQIEEASDPGKARDDTTLPQWPASRLGDDDRLLLECARLLRAHVETVKVAEPSGAERHDTETMRRIKGSVVEAEQLLAGTR